MDELSQYMRDEFNSTQYNILEINKTISRIVPTIMNSNISGNWPYELRRSQEGKPYGYSISTCSMILFSMATALGWVKNSSLLPSFRSISNSKQINKLIFSSITDKNMLKDVYSKSLSEIVKHIKSELRKKAKITTRSGTFGDDDIFTLNWIIELFYATPKNILKSSGANKLIDKLEETAKQTIERVAQGLTEPENLIQYSHGEMKSVGAKPIRHPFYFLRALQLINTLDLKKGTNDLRNKYENNFVKYFENRVNQQIAFDMIPDSRFDPAELAFSIEGILLSGSQRLGVRVRECALDILGKAQEKNPYWRPLTPFVASDRGMTLLPLSVEVANSLLRTCNHLDNSDHEPAVFARFISRFNRFYEWLNARIVRWTEDQREIVGWHSEHVGEAETIHLWETSQVLVFMLHYSALLKQNAAKAALAAANLSLRHPKSNREDSVPADQKPSVFWYKHVSSEKEPLMGIADKDSYQSLKRAGEKFVEPRDDGVNTGSFSLLLYGPPGTGKTGFCKDLSNALGWPLIIVTTSDFLAGGAAEVEARAKAVFDVLQAQDETVILLDEIDHFLLDRQSKMYREQHGIFQFMTPGMLIKLNDLRSKNRSIFVVATNYVERIDPAIKRRGRIDDQLPLMLPDIAGRVRILEGLFRKENDRKRLLTPLSEFTPIQLEVLAKSTLFFSYGEIKQVVVDGLDSLTPGKSAGAATVIKKLVDHASGLHATVNLMSYRSRLESSEEELVQRPLEEWFLLLLLKFEVEVKLEKNEMKLLEKVFGEAINSTTRIKRFLKNEAQIKSTRLINNLTRDIETARGD